MDKMHSSYIGREQAFIKHLVLKTYLERLFMIIGRSNSMPVINYVDCFAGPWQENSETLEDTSIGISLSQIEQCQKSLKETFDKDIRFRALYVEKNADAFGKLDRYLSEKRFDNIEVACFHGDYTELLERIVDWCGENFTFFFIDPTGWRKVVSPPVMQPLLELKKSEFLINLMYDFVNRAATIPAHEADMKDIFGVRPELEDLEPEYRKAKLLQLYRDRLKDFYKGRSSFVQIEKPGRDRAHYFLIYLTRNAIGLKVFKENSESLDSTQQNMHLSVRLRRKFDTTGIQDLFSEQSEYVSSEKLNFNVDSAREYLLKKLSVSPTIIDYELWADFLEETDFLPSEIQAAAKDLLAEEVLENLDADASRRSKNIIRPNYLNKSERWRIRDIH